LEYIDAGWDISPWLFRIIGTNSRVGLFKVDIHSYGLHKVQRVIFIER